MARAKARAAADYRAYLRQVKDPLAFGELLWPDVCFYREQAMIVQSVRENNKTFVPAGNMLGKDFVAAFIALGAFLCPRLFLWPPGCGPAGDEVRIITTSVKDDHLRVLWGEIGRFLQTCRLPPARELGGPLKINHRDLRKYQGDKEDEISYLRGMVSERGEGMAGHHAASTLLIIDEASGVSDLVFSQGDTWAKRMLILGNPNECVTGKQHFFYKGVKAGDVSQN